MVSEQHARADEEASGATGPETQRTLWVLWHHWKLRSAESVSMGNNKNLAEMAGAKRRPGRDVLGADAQAAGSLLSTRSPSGALLSTQQNHDLKNRMRELR